MRRARQRGLEMPYHTLTEADDILGDLPWLDPFSSQPVTPSIGSLLSEREFGQLSESHMEADSGNMPTHLFDTVQQCQQEDGGGPHDICDGDIDVQGDERSDTGQETRSNTELDNGTCSSSTCSAESSQESHRPWILKLFHAGLKFSRSTSMNGVRDRSVQSCVRTRRASSLPDIAQREVDPQLSSSQENLEHNDSISMTSKESQAQVNDRHESGEDDNNFICEESKCGGQDTTGSGCDNSTITIMMEFEDNTVMIPNKTCTEDRVTESSSDISVSSSMYYTAFETLSPERSLETVTEAESRPSIGSSALTSSISRYAV